MARWVVVLLVAVVLVGLAPSANALTTSQQCATGDYNGVVNEGAPRGSICVGAAGHNFAYVGGEPTVACGQVIVADFAVVDGPTTKHPSDPNRCPYGGWASEVHDPAIVKSAGTYYLFATGPGIPTWRSTDRRSWTPIGRVFSAGLPPWAPAAVPGSEFPWAPDVSFFAGTWHLYYAISTFGAKQSAIGVATNPTLDPSSRDYRWTDHGVVVESGDTTDYNAIDPNVIIDDRGRPWLDFGSFWSGIKLVELDPATGKPAQSLLLAPIASRLAPMWGIEAPFIVRRAGYYYLFTSFDACCRGTESTYNIRVGRSRSLAGPYVDDRGVPLLLGGGRLVLAGAGTRRGPGHNAVLRDGKQWLLAFHYYDAKTNGTAKLGIIPLRWTHDGWPVATWWALGK